VPLDLGLGVEVVVEVLGQGVEPLGVVLRHRLDRHSLHPQVPHELEDLGILRVGPLIAGMVDRVPHDVVGVHQGDGEMPRLVVVGMVA
jgi:hypothetical protein